MEALFRLEEPLNTEGLEESDEALECPDGELILRRDLLASGRSRLTVNGSLKPQGYAKFLREQLISYTSQHGQQKLLQAGFQDALMEYSEAAILASIVAEGRVPSFSEIGVPAGPWVLGLADSVGELRRIVTTRLMDGDMEGARRFFGIMEEISGEIMMLDVPDAVAPVRRKQDIVRGIMDRTRSDMTTASMMRI